MDIGGILRRKYDEMPLSSVIPAKAGIQVFPRPGTVWTLAPGLKHSGTGFARVTEGGDVSSVASPLGGGEG